MFFVFCFLFFFHVKPKLLFRIKALTPRQQENPKGDEYSIVEEDDDDDVITKEELKNNEDNTEKQAEEPKIKLEKKGFPSRRKVRCNYCDKVR